MISSIKNKFEIHPFLFAIYPALYLYCRNTDEVAIHEISLPLLIMASLALLLSLALGLIFRNARKAATAASFFLVLFLSYNILRQPLEELNLGGFMPSRHRYFLSLVVISFLAATLALLKTNWDLAGLTRLLNRLSFFMVMLCVGIAAFHRLQLRHGLTPVGPLAAETMADSPFPGETPSVAINRRGEKFPNIYYLVLDGYARGDVLRKEYDYDNSEFLGWLTAKGFYVAHQSRANYGWTFLSLASSLNLSHLDKLAQRMGTASNDLAPLANMIRHNRVAKFLKARGYTYVTFSTGYSNIDIPNSDIFVKSRWSLGEFQMMLLHQTPFVRVLEVMLNSPYLLHRRPLADLFDHLTDQAHEEGPYFVHAHIMAPHYPFLYDAEGNVPDPKSNFFWNYDIPERWKLRGKYGAAYRKGYRDYLAYTNQKVRAAIETILSKSPVPPIIILQSDHGPAFISNLDRPDSRDIEERMSILNAYYLPGGANQVLYQDITPVNTFRAVFNRFFDSRFEMLKDESFFSPESSRYRFKNVTAEL